MHAQNHVIMMMAYLERPDSHDHDAVSSCPADVRGQYCCLCQL